ncbi:MAG: TolC family protein, partial [Calditrichaeota bacterium]
SVNAAYNLNRSTSQSGFINSNQTEGLNYGMNLSFPIFDGFNINRRRQNAELNWQRMQTEFDKTAAAIAADITRAYVSYANYIKQSEIEKDNTKAAREFMEISFARYKVGTLTALEWREAQLKYLDAVNRLIAAQYLAKYAETDLKRLSGQLVQQAEAAASVQ